MTGLPQKIFLIGFSGCGKSTIGPILAAQLGRVFVDTDILIAGMTGKEISQIFAEEGEEAFREMETDVIRGLIGQTEMPQVVALGGGAYVREENRAMIGAAGVAVYLECAQEEIIRRLRGKTDRPLLSGAPKGDETAAMAAARRIHGLLAQRRPFYSMAEVTVSSTKRPPQQVVEEIIRKLVRRHGTD